MRLELVAVFLVLLQDAVAVVALVLSLVEASAW